MSQNKRPKFLIFGDRGNDFCNMIGSILDNVLEVVTMNEYDCEYVFPLDRSSTHQSLRRFAGQQFDAIFLELYPRKEAERFIDVFFESLTEEQRKTVIIFVSRVRIINDDPFVRRYKHLPNLDPLASVAEWKKIILRVKNG
ncbi:hypothetical protein COT97_05810 [Candidatus Falkowbacteria bacterium CG10_big_fil_rev_8_21_14_0_10_39_11]|uniref:Uncharacterized protein n=1 Tax=Candidatus Falkowbacteria bacterium CG10_big_fil_rev_8_21_14_0_10_39_11 TaxID=1974565 RepID=A0A2H0V389_9BACT|nr:MAG: hypothetical protein COT97_05810 [Candidatus Falkowbacteria bacterium CG10_big_fil_rev_8_21_14_0_10_39_11]